MKKYLSGIVALFISLSVFSQSVEKILNKHIEHTGGIKAWKNVTTIVSSGTYNYGGLEFPFITYSKAPDLYKFIVPLNGKFYAQSFDGTKGWKIDAFKNDSVPTSLTGKASREMANEADVELENAFINYKEKGHTAELAGKDSVSGKYCYKIKFTRKSGETETYYFDIKTYDLLKKSAVSKNVEMKGTVLDTYYSDYRIVNGLQFPFRAISKFNTQMILDIIVKEIRLNEPIANSEFQPSSLNKK